MDKTSNDKKYVKILSKCQKTDDKLLTGRLKRQKCFIKEFETTEGVRIKYVTKFSLKNVSNNNVRHNVV